MTSADVKRFSVGGALICTLATTVLYAAKERRFSWAGVIAGAAWLLATSLVRTLLLEPNGLLKTPDDAAQRAGVEARHP